MKILRILMLLSVLIAFSGGWFAFSSQIPDSFFPWIVILVGVGVTLSAIGVILGIQFHTRGILGGVLFGLLLSFLVTSGLGIFPNIPEPRYRATYQKSLIETITEERLQFIIDNFNGDVNISTLNQAIYNVTLVVQARGPTHQIAKNHLNDFLINLHHRSVDDQQRLHLNYTVPSASHSLYAITVNVTLPQSTFINLNATSSNGDINLVDVTGEHLNIATTNGALTFLNVSAQSLTATTSNGDVEGSLEAYTTQLITTNGNVALTLPSTINANYTIQTRNGAIDLTLHSSSQVGYDLDLTTTNAPVTVNLPLMDYRRSEISSKAAKTLWFERKPIQITVLAITSNDSIDVHLY
ncbi:MAG: DUF4097 family beta strand repeat protein [Candidatus Bathyarchaeota archaeon]|nr:MAG: DUF4097 family beta strand repeat protein [Candidatus Bathyarchaeota archaeon]